MKRAILVCCILFVLGGAAVPSSAVTGISCLWKTDYFSLRYGDWYGSSDIEKARLLGNIEYLLHVRNLFENVISDPAENKTSAGQNKFDVKVSFDVDWDDFSSQAAQTTGVNAPGISKENRSAILTDLASAGMLDSFLKLSGIYRDPGTDTRDVWRDLNLRYPDEFSPSWSPDCSRLVFKSWRDGNCNIWLLSGDAVRKLSEHSVDFPSGDAGSRIVEGVAFTDAKWAADTKKIAYLIDGSLYVRNFRKASLISFTGSEDYYLYDFSWMPDNNRLTARGSNIVNGKTGTFIMDAESRVSVPMQQLTGGTENGDYRVFCDPEGNRAIVLGSQTDSDTIYIWDLGDDGFRLIARLHTGERVIGDVLWSNDRTKFAFTTSYGPADTAGQGNKGNVYSILVAGADEIKFNRVYQCEKRIEMLAWSADDFVISFLKGPGRDVYCTSTRAQGVEKKLAISASGFFSMAEGRYGKGFECFSGVPGFPDNRPVSKLVVVFPESERDTLRDLNLLAEDDDLSVFALEGCADGIDVNKRVDEAWIVVSQMDGWGDTLSSMVAAKSASEFVVSPDRKRAAVVIREKGIRSISVVPFDIKGVKFR